MNEKSGNIPGRNFLCENFLVELSGGGYFPGRNLMGGNFPGGNFPGGIFLKLDLTFFLDNFF